MFLFLLTTDFWLLISGVTILAVAVILIPHLAWGSNGAPYIPTQKVSVKKIIKLADIKPGDKAVDLGSGDGRIVIALAKAGIEAHGYEINPTLVFWSRFKIILTGVSGKATIHWKSFWDEDLSNYQIVTLFGITRIMDRLSTKLSLELKPNAIIISNIFQFPHWNYVKKDGNIYRYQKDSKNGKPT